MGNEASTTRPDYETKVEFEDSSSSLTVATDSASVPDSQQFPDNLYSSDLIRADKSTGGIWTSCYSPCGSYLAVGQEDGIVSVRQAQSLDTKFIFERKGPVRSTAYSPDGKFLAVGGDDQTLAIYDTNQYHLLHELKGRGAIRALSFSPDGSRIVVGGKRRNITVYDTSTFEICKTHKRSATVWSMSFSHNGHFICVGGHDRKVVVYDAHTFDTLHEFERASSIRSVSFSPDDKFIAAGGNDHLIEVYDSSTFELIHSHRREGPIETVAFSADGKIIIAGGWDLKVAIYDSSTFEVTREFERSGTIWNVLCSLDGKHIIAGGDDKMIAVYDASRSMAVYELLKEDNVRTVAYSPNGKYIAAGGHDNILSVYCTTSLTLVHELRRAGTIRAIRFSPCSKKLAVGGEDSKLTLYDTSKLSELVEYNINNQVLAQMDEIKDQEMTWQVFAISFSPDGSRLAVGGSGNKVVFLHSINLSVRNEYQREGWVRAISYSSDGTLLAAGGDDMKLTLYNIETDEKVHEYVRNGWIFAVAFSPDDRHLAAGGNDKKLLVHDVSSFNVLFEQDREEVATVAYSPNGRYIATGGNSKKLHVLDVENEYKQFISPICLPSLISAIAFFPLDVMDDPMNDFVTLVIASGHYVTSMKVNSYSVTPVEILSRNKNDSELLAVTDNIPEHVRVKLICAAVLEGRAQLVGRLVDESPLHAILAMDQYANEVLASLEESHQLKELNLIAKSGHFRARTSEENLDEILLVLHELGRKQFTSSVVNLLLAGECGSMPGFVSVAETYLLKKDPKAFWPFSWFLPNQSSTNLPLSESLEPQSFHSTNVIKAWDDLEKDTEKQVQVKILRGLIPDLCTFESLKVLTSMDDNEPFGTHALCAAIDCHWSKWAKYRFHRQAFIYFVWLASFAAFCELTIRTSDEAIANSVDGLISFFAFMTILGILYFIWLECKQIKAMGRAYCADGWNYLQWLTKLLIFLSVMLRLTDTDRAANSVISALGLLLGLLGSFFYLRGVEDCAWIVTALLRIAQNMTSFMIVLLLVILAFAFFFRNLYKGSADPAASTAFGSFWKSFITTFSAGVLGDFEFDSLDETYSTTFSMLMMIVLFVAVMVISLNALIAFISDAFEKVLAQKMAVLKKQKANIILDLYSVLDEKTRTKLENKNRWTTIIVPVETLESNLAKSTQNLSKATREDVIGLEKSLQSIRIELKYDIDRLHHQPNRDVTSYKTELEVLKGEVAGIKDDVKAILSVVQDLQIGR